MPHDLVSTALARPLSPVGAVRFRGPEAGDGSAVWRLVASCPPLDVNSRYAVLLQCTHFADTCVMAERDGDVLGWVSGHRPPSEPDAIFVWQVAVSEKARGRSLGKALLDALLARPGVRGSRRLIATVSPSNAASRRMFEGFAARRGLSMDVRPHFERDLHFGGTHEAEHLISIGPLGRAPRSGATANPEERV